LLLLFRDLKGSQAAVLNKLADSLKAGKPLMRIAAIAVALLGLIMLVLSLLADTVGLGGAPRFFGWKQIAGVVGGVIMILLGFIYALPRVGRQ
jgi:asparagine N-glycosylation enzyme membrane subunit Stt3